MKGKAMLPAVEYAHSRQDSCLEDLKALCAIPSISSMPAHREDIARAAHAVAERLTAAGLENAAVLPTAGHPVVYAEHLHAGADRPTILFYGHYDVQPALDLDMWRTPPFEPTVIGENLFGRGASDMKGQFAAAIFAVEACLRSENLPANVKFMIEGEEEIGSPSLKGFLQANAGRLRCDTVFNADAGMAAPDLPTITYALRGGMRAEITFHGPQHDLHSGTFGGTVLNPAQALIEVIAGMHDADGRVTLPGFYDRVRPLEPAERADLARLPLGPDFFLSESGAPALWGEPEFTPLERTTARPTLEVLSIHAGLAGEGQLNIVPASATAALSTRLVPEMEPGEAYAALLAYLEAHAPPEVRWEAKYIVGSRPALMDRSGPAMRAWQRAARKVWGVEPAFMRIGGGIPVVSMIKDVLGLDSLLTGFGLMDDNIHGPNEKLHLPTWRKGIEAIIHFLQE